MKKKRADQPAPAFRAEDYGWQGRSYEPQPSVCKQCGAAIPPQRKRGAAFGGYGRARELCDAKCRKRWSRAHPRAVAAR